MEDITPEKIEVLKQKIDPEGLLDIAYNMNNQIEEMLRISDTWEIPDFSPKNVLICGLGGSAIGGDLVRALTEKEIKVPVIMCRDYDIPEFVGENTLCICVSYSGNTEETLSAYRHCKEKGATIIAISTDGEINKMASKDNVCFCRVPAGYQPRSALAISFCAQLIIFIKMKLIKDYSRNLQATVSFLESLSNRWLKWKTPPDNPPLELAMNLVDKIPAIFGSTGFLGTMAYRWKCQFNENAKMLATYGVIPEMDHNEIVGWHNREDFYKDRYIVFLRDQNEPPRIKARVDYTIELLSRIAPVKEIYPEGKNELEKLFYFVLFGDLVSIYLAYFYQKDPAEIDSIHWLKKKLAESNVFI